MALGESHRRPRVDRRNTQTTRFDVSRFVRSFHVFGTQNTPIVQVVLTQTPVGAVWGETCIESLSPFRHWPHGTDGIVYCVYGQ